VYFTDDYGVYYVYLPKGSLRSFIMLLRDIYGSPLWPNILSEKFPGKYCVYSQELWRLIAKHCENSDTWRIFAVITIIIANTRNNYCKYSQ